MRFGFRALSWAIVIILLMVITLIVFGAMQIPVDRLISTATFDEKLLLELFIVLVIWLVAKLIHEGGHLLAALAQKERDTVDPTWKLFLSEQAYIQALEASHSFDARQEWEAPGRGAVPAFMRLRLETAMHLAEGVPAKAREALGRALRETEDYYDTGTRLEERYLLDIIESRLAT